MQAVTKLRDNAIRDLLFEDDRANTEQEMQLEVNNISTACNNFGVIMSTKKTEVILYPAPYNLYQDPCITVKGQCLQATENFMYLGRTLTHSVNIDAETNNRISSASSTFGGLREEVLERRGISLATKLQVYRAVVLTTLLYWLQTVDR